MSEVYDELANTLRERLDIISDEQSRQSPEAHMKRLQNVSERIETLERQLPSDVDPQLRHFLQRRSYSKALELISENTTRRSTAR
jgi:hypothetical protein